MQQLARKENDLILLGNHSLVRPLADVPACLQSRVVDLQFAALELPRLAMEEIHKRQVARCHPIAGVVTVKVEVIAIVAGGDLRLYAGDRKFFHAEFLEHLR